jgi:hypothetical protein
MHPETVSIAHRQGMDPQELEALMGCVLYYIHAATLDSPVSVDSNYRKSEGTEKHWVEMP